MKTIAAIIASALVTLGLSAPSPSHWSGGGISGGNASPKTAPKASAAAVPSCRERMQANLSSNEKPFLFLDFAAGNFVLDGRNVPAASLFENQPKMRQESDVRSGVKFGAGGLNRAIRLNRAISEKLVGKGEMTMELDIVQTSTDKAQTIFDFVAAVGSNSNHVSLDRRSERDSHDWLRGALQMNVYSNGGTPKLVLKNGSVRKGEILDKIVTVRATIKNGEYRLQDRSSGEVSRKVDLKVPRLDYLYLGGDRSGKQPLHGYIRAVRIYRKAIPASMTAVRTGTHQTVGFQDFSLNGDSDTMCLWHDADKRQQISFDVRPGDQWQEDVAEGRTYAERSELRQTSTMKKGVVYWNAFEFMVDNYARGSAKSDFVILAQYHAGSSKIRSPWLALRLGNPKTEGRTARFVVTRGDKNGKLGRSSSGAIPQFQAGKWYKVAIETKADPADGFARIWVNGRLIVDDRGAIGYADASGAGYFRFGIYRTSGTLGATMVRFKNVTGTTTQDLSGRI